MIRKQKPENRSQKIEDRSQKSDTQKSKLLKCFSLSSVICHLFFCCLSAIFVLILNSNAWGLTKAEEEEIRKEAANFKYNTVTTKEGLSFRVPEDMPVETRNGIQAPIPFDEYMYGKFKSMDDRLKSIDAKLDRIEKILISNNESKDKVLKG